MSVVSISVYGKNQVHVFDDQVYKHGIVADDKTWVISEPTTNHFTKPRSMTYKEIQGYTYTPRKISFTFFIYEPRFKNSGATAKNS